jgi:adenylate kinase family enzyme
MKIIVCGMDNTGKTTLCNSLSVRTGFKIVRIGGPEFSKESMMEDTLLYLNDGKSIIFERFPIFEEMVYGKVLRGKSKFEYSDIEAIKKYKPIIIYCRPSKDVIFNFGKREQMKGVIEQKEALVKAWDDLMIDTISGFKIIKYDWTKDKLGYLVGGIKNEYYTCD